MKNQPNKGTVKDGLPTAEQVLHRHFVPVDPFDNLQILQAMQEFSDQQNAELDKMGEQLSAENSDLSSQIEGLKAWKESAMRELNALDLQSLGAKMGIGLGQSVSENVHTKVDGLSERVRELEVAISKISTITVDDIAFKLAKEALKQQ